MSTNWINKSNLSFNNLLLLERVQLSWLPGWLPEREMALALKANPVVAWYLGHKCPEIESWLEKLNALDLGEVNEPEIVYNAEQNILKHLDDLLVYVIDPSIYDVQPFLGWDTSELTSVTDFRDKIVLDIGSGTGKLAFAAAPQASVVYCVEPVANLRFYIRQKAKRQGFDNLFAVDGLITEIPFPDGFADITMGGHVFGDYPQDERREMERVTCMDGMVVLCPGNNDRDNSAHQELITRGYQWSRFLEPEDNWVRKYWKEIKG